MKRCLRLSVLGLSALILVSASPALALANRVFVSARSAGSGTVVLRGLVLNGGSGKGIKVTAAGVVHVENCVVSGFSQEGISTSAAGGNLYVKDTISRQNLNGIVSDNLQVGLDNASGDATFESLGNNMVRGNLGGETNNTITPVLGK